MLPNLESFLTQLDPHLLEAILDHIAPDPDPRPARSFLDAANTYVALAMASRALHLLLQPPAETTMLSCELLDATAPMLIVQYFGSGVQISARDAQRRVRSRAVPDANTEYLVNPNVPSVDAHAQIFRFVRLMFSEAYTHNEASTHNEAFTNAFLHFVVDVVRDIPFRSAEHDPGNISQVCYLAVYFGNARNYYGTRLAYYLHGMCRLPEYRVAFARARLITFERINRLGSTDGSASSTSSLESHA